MTLCNNRQRRRNQSANEEWAFSKLIRGRQQKPCRGSTLNSDRGRRRKRLDRFLRPERQSVRTSPSENRQGYARKACFLSRLPVDGRPGAPTRFFYIASTIPWEPPASIRIDTDRFVRIAWRRCDMGGTGARGVSSVLPSIRSAAALKGFPARNKGPSLLPMGDPFCYCGEPLAADLLVREGR